MKNQWIPLIILMFILYWAFAPEAKAQNSWTGVIQNVTTTSIAKDHMDGNQVIGTGAGAAVGYGVTRMFLGKSAGWIGAGLGAVAGSAMTNSNSALTITVKLDNGMVQTVTQRRDKFPDIVYNRGDRVVLVNMNGDYFVVK